MRPFPSYAAWTQSFEFEAQLPATRERNDDVIAFLDDDDWHNKVKPLRGQRIDEWSEVEIARQEAADVSDLGHEYDQICQLIAGIIGFPVQNSDLPRGADDL